MERGLAKKTNETKAKGRGRAPKKTRKRALTAKNQNEPKDSLFDGIVAEVIGYFLGGKVYRGLQLCQTSPFIVVLRSQIGLGGIAQRKQFNQTS